VKLVKIDHEIFLLDGGDLIRLGGERIPYPGGGEEVGTVKSLGAWQADPGRAVRGGHYVLMVVKSDYETFVAGGSFVYATAYAEAHDCTLALMRAYDSRRAARAAAERLGGVGW
jgi:hypothetical protein